MTGITPSACTLENTLPGDKKNDRERPDCCTAVQRRTSGTTPPAACLPTSCLLVVREVRSDPSAFRGVCQRYNAGEQGELSQLMCLCTLVLVELGQRQILSGGIASLRYAHSTPMTKLSPWRSVLMCSRCCVVYRIACGAVRIEPLDADAHEQDRTCRLIIPLVVEHEQAAAETIFSSHGTTTQKHNDTTTAREHVHIIVPSTPSGSQYAKVREGNAV